MSLEYGIAYSPCKQSAFWCCRQDPFIPWGNMSSNNDVLLFYGTVGEQTNDFIWILKQTVSKRIVFKSLH